MRILGVDPGTAHTGYGCIDTAGSRHAVLDCGALSPPPRAALAEKLRLVHAGLTACVRAHRPDVVALEDPFYARNARTALVLGQVRGVVLLAAAEAGLPVAAYAPAEIKRAVVGYGRAEKRQVQQMVGLLLGLAPPPARLDVTDALAVAICHAHAGGSAAAAAAGRAGPSAAVASPPGAPPGTPRSWRRYRPPGRRRALPPPEKPP